VTSSWEVAVANGSSAAAGSAYAYAVCVSAAAVPGRVVVHQSTPVAAGVSFTVHVKCPAGTVSVGGGFSLTNPGILMTANYPVADVTDPTSSWEVAGPNGSSAAAGSAYAYAVCVSAAAV